MIDFANKTLEEIIEASAIAEGHFVEIGAGVGDTTKKLLYAAKLYNRQVVVIDPFEEGWNEMPESYGKPYRFKAFELNTQEYKDNLVLCKKNSLSKDSESVCKHLQICFAYVDGLQYKGAVLNDLRIVSHAHVICVDDMNRNTDVSQVPDAVYEFVKQNNKTLIIKDRWAFIV